MVLRWRKKKIQQLDCRLNPPATTAGQKLVMAFLSRTQQSIIMTLKLLESSGSCETWSLGESVVFWCVVFVWSGWPRKSSRDTNGNNYSRVRGWNDGYGAWFGLIEWFLIYQFHRCELPAIEVSLINYGLNALLHWELSSTGNRLNNKADHRRKINMSKRYIYSKTSFNAQNSR